MDIKPFTSPIYVTRPSLPSFDEFQDQIREIWETGIVTNHGPKVQQLEEELTHFLKVGHTSVFCNGTIALLCAIKALGITGEVITTPFTFPATPHVLTWQGIKPVFCDIDPATMNIDPKKIEACITSKTSAILAVHVYGTPCAVKEIEGIAKKHGLKVIYDAAHAFGVKVDGRGIGTFGDVSMFSFHATKLFHTIEGGCLTFRDSSLDSIIYSLRNFGIENEEVVSLPGINGKMNEFQAVVGLLNLPQFSENIQKRKVLFEHYGKHLDSIPGICLQKPLTDVKSNYQYLVIRVDSSEFGISRDELYQKLKKYNVFTRKYFYPPCHRYPHYREDRCLRVADEASEQVLCLPIYLELNTDDIDRICMMIRNYQCVAV